MLGVSPGAVGTAVAQQHVRNILAFLDVPVQPQPEAFLQFREGMVDEHGQTGEASRPCLQKWMDGYVDWVRKGMLLREHEERETAGTKAP